MAGTIYGSKIQGMRAAVGDTLVELGKKNDRIVVIDAETAVATNIMPFKEAFPDRFLTTCIAEQNAISVAYGLQRMGYIPLFLCLPHLSEDVLSIRYLCRQVIRMPISR